MYLKKKYPLPLNSLRSRAFSRTEAIGVLNIPTKYEQLLITSGITTVGKFYNTKMKKFIKIKGIGTKTAKYLMSVKREIKLISFLDSSKIISLHRSKKKSNIKRSDKLIGTIFNSIDLPNRVFRDDPIEILGLPARIENVLKMRSLETIGEFYDCPDKYILKFRSIGQNSLRYLQSVKGDLKPLLRSHDSSTSLDEQKTKITKRSKAKLPLSISRDKLVDLLIGRAGDERSTDIIKLRYGLKKGEKETLEEIGKSYGISRERVRQLQNKALRKIRHPSTRGRNLVIHLIEDMFMKNGVVISDSEADTLVPRLFNNYYFDGSSFLDLVVGLGWIQKSGDVDVSFYTFKDMNPGLELLMQDIYSFLKDSKELQTVESICENLCLHTPINRKSKYTSNTHLKVAVSKVCKIDPRIEETIPDKFTIYGLNVKTNIWTALIREVLEKEESPLHFTEIADKANDILSLVGDKELDVRRVHSILIEKPEFSHTGVRGTYGLTEWGIRKEMLPELIEECIKQAGFPIHVDQIFYYISKFKNTSKTNVFACLYSNKKFVRVDDGTYWLKGEKKFS